MAFPPRSDATKHAVTDGETLASIASTEGITEAQLAFFNFGTDDPKEVNRALVEIVGCNKPTPDGKTFEFTATDSSRGSGEIFIPKKFVKDQLSTGKTYVGSLKKLIPMCAVDITELDKWFVPGEAADGGEECTIKYALEGKKKVATKVALEVYGSNYCSVTQDAAYEVKFTALASVIPIYTEPLSAAQGEPRQSHAIPNWRGQSTAADGVLKPGASGTRRINVAFSPYTVHLRYFEKDDEKEARILLQDFWPQFDASNNVVPASLEIKWKVEKTSRLEFGQLIIVDRSDKVVFRQGLQKAKLSEGDQSFTWDGKLLDGTNLKPTEMPYRVQIQGHTGLNEKQGLALAAMHTEVRVFVDPLTGQNPNEPFKDPNSLELDLAPLVTQVPTQAGEVDKWVQHQLALGGFHPGPIDGNLARSETKTAIAEFQRSFPVADAGGFKRLTASGTKDADTELALTNLVKDTRPWFGDPGSRADVTTPATVKTQLNANGGTGLVVWVDDRHYYTEPAAGLPANFDLGNYRANMSVGDGRVGYDADSITRPWLPFLVKLPLLGKDAAHQGVAANNKLTNDAASQAVGPLRVDLVFEELDAELSSIDQSHGAYNKNEVRTNKWVDEVLKAQAGTHNGRTWKSCPEASGGARPAAVADYYKKLISHQNDSLLPWKAYDDTPRSVICTVVHDDYGQAATELHGDRRGCAGAFFNPSRVAGDGYRFGARLGFDEVTGAPGSFPNREVLARRYPKKPQVYSGPLRLWRKTSFRGYLFWCDAARKKWASNSGPAAELYRPACLHFVEEKPASGGAFLDANASALVSAPLYTTIVQSKVTGPFTTQPITLDPKFVWPFLTAKRWGIAISPPGTTIETFRDKVLSPMLNQTWRRFRERLIWELLAQVEKQQGLFKGHLIVQFQDSPSGEIWEYECQDCHQTFVEYVENLPLNERIDKKPCPACGASGKKDRPKKTRDGKTTLLLPAVGVGMGATWVFSSGQGEVWTHEMGHHRHLEHAQSNPGSAATAPGAKNAHHDSQPNTFKFGAGAAGKEQCWDLRCVMSYNHKQYFCGKCVLKTRGWRVIPLANPAGGLHD